MIFIGTNSDWNDSTYIIRETSTRKLHERLIAGVNMCSSRDGLLWAGRGGIGASSFLTVVVDVIQVILIDDFRSRLVQVANQAESPWETPFAQIMNAMWWVSRTSETLILQGSRGFHRLRLTRPFFLWEKNLDNKGL